MLNRSTTALRPNSKDQGVGSQHNTPKLCTDVNELKKRYAQSLKVASMFVEYREYVPSKFILFLPRKSRAGGSARSRDFRTSYLPFKVYAKNFDYRISVLPVVH